MRVAIYARVSTERQAQTQTIEQQVTRLQEYVQEHGWTLEEHQIYRDDGYSGASLNRPGLDALRDHLAQAALDVVVITAPDRLARKYVHQVLLLEELERQGCRVDFVDRPMSKDPHDQLLLQIRGAVAEYERALITDRMRRGRLTQLRAGRLLPWTRRVYGYQLDPERPRDPSGVRLDAYEAAMVRQIFAWYLEEGASLYRVSQRLGEGGITAPRGRAHWTPGSVRGILQNSAYIGTTYGNRYQTVPAQLRRSALLPLGAGKSYRARSNEEWIPIQVPAIVTQEVFDMAQSKLSQNHQRASRNNTRNRYLVRGLISCGACHLTATGLTTATGYRYYVCRGRADKLRAAEGQSCTARFIPADQVEDLVWEDLCAVLVEPEQVVVALERAHGGAWHPQDLQARRDSTEQAMVGIDRQQNRLLEAYLAAVLDVATFGRKRQELDRQRDALQQQMRQLDSLVQHRVDIAQLAGSIEDFCQRVRDSLKMATFEQKRELVEFLIDCVVVTDGDVEIRYVLPTGADGPHRPFYQLRTDYRGGVSEELRDLRGGRGQHQRVHRGHVRHQAAALRPGVPAADRI
jgi:site-specific DNA recombinase